MKEKLEEMMNDIIKKYGFENENTIRFCKACESIEKPEESALYILLFICPMYMTLMNN